MTGGKREGIPVRPGDFEQALRSAPHRTTPKETCPDPHAGNEPRPAPWSRGRPPDVPPVSRGQADEAAADLSAARPHRLRQECIPDSSGDDEQKRDADARCMQ
jgi:hypothetical protein